MRRCRDARKDADICESGVVYKVFSIAEMFSKDGWAVELKAGGRCIDAY